MPTQPSLCHQENRHYEMYNNINNIQLAECVVNGEKW